ncbi:MAG TPA: cysteine desulfurase family protein [Bacillales bacterium]|nr:cysteine desulfurase family protein [Bacillales bacterium]
MIYLDNSATTKPYPEVLETYKTVAEKYFANPSSVHGIGGEAERLLKQARQIAADLLKVHAKEIVFTSGGTEADNMAVKGTAFYYRARGKHIITTEMEHPAVFEACQQLESFGFEVTYLPAHKNGQVSINDLEKAIRPDTTLVSMIHVNNELGTIQPVEEAGRFLSQYPKIQFHVDHVQGVTKVPLNLKAAGIDLCSISGHKFHGPRGTGLLYMREGTNLMPLISGGDQEDSVRSGTENLPGIVAMTKALRLGFDSAETGIPKLKALNEQLRKALQETDGIRINTPSLHAAPHIVNFSVEGVKPEVLIHALEERGIYVSTKSACSSREGGASRVLLAAGIPEKQAEEAIRVSLAFQNKEQDITEIIKAIREIVPDLRKVGGKA